MAATATNLFILQSSYEDARVNYIYYFQLEDEVDDCC